MDVPAFIQRVLIEEFEEIQQEGRHPHILFSLICPGIEFLGACLDPDAFSCKGLSAPRFRRAIYELFPSTYHPFNQGSGRPFDLYDNLRCALFDVVLPGARLELIQRSETTTLNVSHLEIKEIGGTDRLVLVLENLLDDFEKACQEIMERIRDGRLSGWKVTGDLASRWLF